MSTNYQVGGLRILLVWALIVIEGCVGVELIRRS